MMTMTTKIDIPENEAVVASPVTNAMAGYEQKMGHRCCGCCCDSRRAVIIVECIFGIAFNAIGIGLLLTAANISTMFDDDGFGNELARESIITSIIYGVGVLVSFVTICGAVNFKVPLVAVGIVWTVCQTITDVVLQAQSYSEAGLRYPIIDAVIRISVAGLLLYPSAVFVAECRSGIMSRQNYAKEQYSCCCV